MNYHCNNFFIGHLILFGSLIACFISVYSRNTSVDESYEFDATECRIGLELLEAMKMEQAGMGQKRELRCNRPLTSTGLQDFQEKGETPISFRPIYTYIASIRTNVTSTVLPSCSLVSSFYLFYPLQTQIPWLVFTRPPSLHNNNTVIHLVRHVSVP